MSEAAKSFDDMKARLDQIADEVSAEGISLDEALALYEEAVKLGLAACDVSESDILVPEEDAEGPSDNTAPNPLDSEPGSQAPQASPASQDFSTPSTDVDSARNDGGEISQDSRVGAGSRPHESMEGNSQVPQGVEPGLAPASDGEEADA